jgi:predicted nucleotide-binding protein
MEASRAINLLESLLTMVTNLNGKYGQYHLVKEFKTRAKIIIRTVFDFDEKLVHEYENEVNSLRFIAPLGKHTVEAWDNGVKNADILIRAMIEHVLLLDEQGKFSVSFASNISKEKSNHIFIVHGHDEDMKQKVALFIYELGLRPIMLAGEANGGFKSVMEKFEQKAREADFAIVLLSPDDVGYAKRDGEKAAKSRARQNVIFELGYFLGALGRSNVIAFTKLDENNEPIEQPSDIIGGVIEPFGDNWQERIRKELKEAGYQLND